MTATETIAAPGPGPLTLEEALTRLRAAIARHEPGFVPTCVTHDGGPYRHYFDHRKMTGEAYVTRDHPPSASNRNYHEAFWRHEGFVALLR